MSNNSRRNKSNQRKSPDTWFRSVFNWRSLRSRTAALIHTPFSRSILAGILVAALTYGAVYLAENTHNNHLAGEEREQVRIHLNEMGSNIGLEEMESEVDEATVDGTRLLGKEPRSASDIERHTILRDGLDYLTIYINHSPHIPAGERYKLLQRILAEQKKIGLLEKEKAPVICTDPDHKRGCIDHWVHTDIGYLKFFGDMRDLLK